MYQPKYVSPGRHRHPWLPVLTAALVLLLTGSTTWAWLSHSTQELRNTFALAAPPTPVIHEDFDGSVKSNVTLTNMADYPCYIRATVAAALLDDAGNVIGRVPQPGADYAISYGNWLRGSDGSWYWPVPVPAGGQTGALITSCTQLASEGQLEITILSQSIQARPARAVSNSWGVTVDGEGRISP